ncbi:stearoyl-CoA 9-desaturase [Tilletia horrida]|nr:stearoyl-CoA 9-desaturase [Tilletia horrida]
MHGPVDRQADSHRPTKPTYADADIQDDYVRQMLSKPPDRLPFELRNVPSEIQWISTLVLTLTPILAIYGACTTPLQMKTVLWAGAYYFLTELG